MASTPDPNTVANLQRKFSGLDNDLNYVSGHSIWTEYQQYKQEQFDAGVASQNYAHEANVQKARKPYREDEKATGPVGGSLYYQGGHAVLEPLAGAAATAAERHGDSRDSFNDKYEEVLKAKGEYSGHAEAAQLAHNSAKRFSKMQRQHNSHMSSP
ncbi:hypothetical protein F4806DRAFT_462650 [Annulohypoxylon nitens]|nr:hypothetical protein F4806DRAFT_462650 [Annulohypoxylon nitens]